MILWACTAPQQRTAPVQSSPAGSGESKFFTGIPSAKEKSESNTFAEVERGYAAWYGKEMHGKPTASGEIFDMYEFTVSHRTYPMGSVVLVRNLENGKKHLATVNDRGPYVDGRICDVSYAVANALGFIDLGVAHVELELIEEGADNFAAKLEEGPTRTQERGMVTTAEDPFLDAPGAPLAGSGTEGFVFSDGSSPKGYTVRLGAFKSRRNAEKFREELEEAYHIPAYIGAQGIWNFVWIGDFTDAAEASQFYEDLKTDGRDVMDPEKVQ